MKTTTVILAAESTTKLRDIINNFGSEIQFIGGTIIGVVFIIVAVMIGIGALSAQGNLRQHLGKISLAVISAIGIGMASILGPLFIGAGEDISNSNSPSTSQQDSGVN